MATELSLHLQRLSKAQQHKMGRTQDILIGQYAAAENMTMERFLEGIYVFRCHDQAELLATIIHLNAFLQNKTRIKCILIDSIAFHFRSDLQDITTRNRVLSQLTQTLHQIAYEHKLAVVLINHVTTKLLRQQVGELRQQVGELRQQVGELRQQVGEAEEGKL
jgi:RecA/RadA recombinase